MDAEKRTELERTFDKGACERLAAAHPDYYNEHGYYLPMVASLLNATRAERDRLREEREDILTDLADIHHSVGAATVTIEVLRERLSDFARGPRSEGGS